MYERTLNVTRLLMQISKKKNNSEKERWHDVLKRVTSCIEFLAENNDPFRGTNSKLIYFWVSFE